MHNSAYSRVRARVRDSVRGAAAALEVAAKHRQFSRLAWRNGRLVADVPRTPGGALYVHLLDLGVGRPLFTGRGYEEEETRFLQGALRPGMTVVDVGANIGFITTFAAKCVGPEGRVLAIEPEPGNAALLRENVRRNGYQNVAVQACAVGSRPGSATLYRSSWNQGNHRIDPGALGQAIADDSISVPIETADELVRRSGLERVDLIKVDVEGYEPAVLSGFHETIARSRPTILTEFWPGGIRDAGFDPTQFLEEFLSNAYVVHSLAQPERRLASAQEILATLAPDDPGAYANLVFSPRP